MMAPTPKPRGDAPSAYDLEIARYFLEGHTIDQLAAGYHLHAIEVEKRLRCALTLREGEPFRHADVLAAPAPQRKARR